MIPGTTEVRARAGSPRWARCVLTRRHRQLAAFWIAHVHSDREHGRRCHPHPARGDAEHRRRLQGARRDRPDGAGDQHLVPLPACVPSNNRPLHSIVSPVAGRRVGRYAELRGQAKEVSPCVTCIAGQTTASIQPCCLALVATHDRSRRGRGDAVEQPLGEMLRFRLIAQSIRRLAGHCDARLPVRQGPRESCDHRTWPNRPPARPDAAIEIRAGDQGRGFAVSPTRYANWRTTGTSAPEHRCHYQRRVQQNSRSALLTDARSRSAV